MNRTDHAQSGSVIIWILVCVAMFAALSFTVANMMRGGGTGVNEELTRVQASEIVAYTETMRRAAQALRVDGHNVTEISFENEYVSGYANPRCGGDECRMFGSAGGGVNYNVPSEDWLDKSFIGETYYREWHFAPDVCVAGVGRGIAGCAADTEDNEDLVVFLPYVKKSICVEINRQLGIENTDGNPPADVGCPWDSGTEKRFTGAFEEGESIESSVPETLEGRQTGCFQMGVCGALTDPVYHYYQVLVAR